QEAFPCRHGVESCLTGSLGKPVNGLGESVQVGAGPLCNLKERGRLGSIHTVVVVGPVQEVQSLGPASPVEAGGGGIVVSCRRGDPVLLPGPVSAEGEEVPPPVDEIGSASC